MTLAPPIGASPPPPQPIKKLSPAATPVASPRDLPMRKAPPIVPKIVMYAGEKFGKTSFGAYAEEPFIFMVGETGYDTLLSASRAPNVPAVVVDSWQSLLDWIDALIVDPKGRKTVVVDGIGALDRLCQEHVCARAFGNDWNDPKNGFLSWGGKKAYGLCATEWLKLLQRLETLRTKHGVVPVLIGHAVTTNTPNPVGADFMTYTCNCEKQSWPEICRWADCILFGRFFSIVETAKSDKGNIAEKTGKGIGGVERVLYTEGRDAFVAGNRYGMTPEFTLPKEPSQMWSTVLNEIRRSK